MAGGDVSLPFFFLDFFLADFVFQLHTLSFIWEKEGEPPHRSGVLPFLEPSPHIKSMHLFNIFDIVRLIPTNKYKNLRYIIFLKLTTYNYIT